MEIAKADGWKGGTLVLWRDQLDWDIIYTSKQITGISIPLTNGERWTLWTCYGLVEKAHRREFWENLTILIKNGTKAWACIGDLNEVMDHEEKRGGREMNMKSNGLLKEFMDEVQGMDISFNGNIFT